MRWRRLWRILRHGSLRTVASAPVSAGDPAPPVDELFSAEQMEQHGRMLAGVHGPHAQPGRDGLLERLGDNEEVLLGARKALALAARSASRIAPAAEWLLDNFYLIEEQIGLARRHLPKAYSRELPRLAQGPSRGRPRVYELAHETIAHGDGRVDAATLQRFVAAYQTITPLKLGELWAIPIMLRLALIENLRRLAERVLLAARHLQTARDWATRMRAIAQSDPKSLILVIADMARSDPPLTSSFVAELARQLQGHGPSLALPLTWIEQRLTELSLSIEQRVLSETQQQAAEQVSISNTIGSLRFLAATDWRRFVESLSEVDRVLNQDPARVYGEMDFATRDAYRHVVEAVARRGRLAESEVARAAVTLAQAAALGASPMPVEGHVGFYLVDRGLRRLEATIGAEGSTLARLRRGLASAALPLYLGAIGLISAGVAALLLVQAQDAGVRGSQLALLGGLALLAASQAASAVVSWIATLLARPLPLPRMDFAQGIPSENRTLVVIPALLDGGIELLLENLEVRFLGNRDEGLSFGLLTDFRDAAQATLPTDPALLECAQQGILKLNLQYGSAQGDRFFLFHRPRRWNAAEGAWMGHERKRGKLGDLNALLRDGRREAFSLIVGEWPEDRAVRYVITLDTDTELPRDAARQFVATMAHPLNRPRYDSVRGRVTGGYGILQPRMAASLAGQAPTRYAQLFGSEPGIDPYTRAVSDVYQDLFGEGSFIGKGIYDVDAFEHMLAHRFPDNRVLSHDLLEGCYARSGLISDVHLYEDYPSTYALDVARQRRWIRGDWQIARWAFPRVPGPAQTRLANPLSTLSRWKIVDNLRRSLAPAALLGLLLLGWFVLPRPALWTLAGLGLVLVPALLPALVDALRGPGETGRVAHLLTVAASAGRNLAIAVFRIACLPYEVACGLGAILRTLWRLGVTRRRLLEWNVSPAGGEKFRHGAGGPASALVGSYRAMWSAPVLALAALPALAAGIAWGGAAPDRIVAALPILLCWLGAPALAWWVSQPSVAGESRLDAEQQQFLRRVARKTWAFFDRFVGPEDHWLPPDNFQELPGPITAHRTSPTNMGLSLLANLGACDFGYLTVSGLIERTGQSLRSMAGLPRHRTHFYNWYDTQSLQVLSPRYVSTVDSGNLAAHLFTLQTGLLTLPDRGIVPERLFEGLADTVQVLHQTLDETASANLDPLRSCLASALARREPTPREAIHDLQDLADLACAVVAALHAAPGSDTDAWARALERQCREALTQLHALSGEAALDDAPAGMPPIAPIRRNPTLREIARMAAPRCADLESRIGREEQPLRRNWLVAVRDAIATSGERAAVLVSDCERLAGEAAALAPTDYGMLYDPARDLLAIGFNVDSFRRDLSCYDLLASEARLASFVAIAQGQVPQSSWFALGRLLTRAGGRPVLMSWSGSMFEYLMPVLVMPSYAGTLLDQTCRGAVAQQIALGQRRSTAWGVSESGYCALDAASNYQYHAFGTPGLGLQRGLADNSVVAPYASALALMVAPEAACRNLQRLSDEGIEGRYGFYEAVDYTASRMPRGQTRDIVRSFMAHHQGMSLLALAHVLLDRPMQRRFESTPLFQATLLLLQERVPKRIALEARPEDPSTHGAPLDVTDVAVRTPFGPNTASPEVQLLSNGRYHVMLTSAGGGSSRWKDLAVTRWREDHTCDNWGSFVYLRDLASGGTWSAAHQPTLAPAQSYEARFSEGRVEFRRQDHDCETYSEIVVSPADDVELRRLRITNHADMRRTIELTTYAEVALAPPAADLMQPAFGNLFVQTRIVRERHAILCTRRPRSKDEPTPWMFHLLATHGAEVGEVSYETDRLRFIGRGRDLARPRAMSEPGALSDTEGSVLDPVVAIRCVVTLERGQTATLDWVTGAAASREACMALVDRYQDRSAADRVLDLAWTHAGVTLRQINASDADAELYRRLAGPVVYAQPLLRAAAPLLRQNRRGQSGLWGYSISGDLPIVLLKISEVAHLELARQMIQCHVYWRLKGLAVDLVIWNEEQLGYRQGLQDQILGLIARGYDASAIDRPGGVFVHRGEQISNEDRVLLQAVARVVIDSAHGTLAEHLARLASIERRVGGVAARRTRPFDAKRASSEPATPRREDEVGEFNADASEYRIATSAARITPLPWVNVLANPNFGCVVAESGLAYTWSENAHEFRLTPWSQDAVGATGGEAFFLRDEDSRQHWSPSPQPCPGSGSYLSRHGFGYSVFEHVQSGIQTELRVYVDLEEPVKFSVLKVRNDSGRPRRLSATGYVEWVLGDLRPRTAMHVVTEIDASSGALFARNAYSAEFGDRVAFFDVDDPGRTLTGDRTEFLGRNGSLRMPNAMTRERLSGRLGAGLDPCGAIQSVFELADGESREIIFRLGAGRDLGHARKLAQGLRRPGTAREALEKVRAYWKRILSTVQVETPDAALNALANGWLVYQTLACRLWARSGYSQSGGAFGFRDQLQDVMALVHAEPGLVREHLLRSAGRQYAEGDVQHWWHPPAGRGVRTRCSDDYLWLPLAVARYVGATGDTDVLEQVVPFLWARSLGQDEESHYHLPEQSAESATLYEHCVRAIRYGLRFGERGLPLMGSGDWNDGMNRVGIHGQGESVWLGFFLDAVLKSFATVARGRGETAFAEQCGEQAQQLRRNLEAQAWDGGWYRRAWFDDGTPLGSSANLECRIDSISQSWSVLSGAGDATRTRTAMDAVDRHLVRRGAAPGQGLVQLLDPPFDVSPVDPGYIKGYVPGVRENGGQYTHAAIWAAMAFAQLGDAARAWELVSIINPLNHARTPEEAQVYKAEPYVVAADVYAVAPHVGRGGWTWYTGSAAWMYRLILESLLGLRLEANHLRFVPCLPADWSGFSLRYRFRETLYRIRVHQQDNAAGATPGAIDVSLDGVSQPGGSVPLTDDRAEHEVEVHVTRRVASSGT